MTQNKVYHLLTIFKHCPNHISGIIVWNDINEMRCKRVNNNRTLFGFLCVKEYFWDFRCLRWHPPLFVRLNHHICSKPQGFLLMRPRNTGRTAFWEIIVRGRWDFEDTSHWALWVFWALPGCLRYILYSLEGIARMQTHCFYGFFSGSEWINTWFSLW